MSSRKHQGIVLEHEAVKYTRQAAGCRSHKKYISCIGLTCELVYFLQVIASVSDYDIVVWDANSGQQVAILKGHKLNVHVLEGHPYMYDIVMSASYDGQTIIWDIEKCTQLIR